MFENGHPKVSVIMPVFNASRFLQQAVESILDQTYKAFEFIIIDDCSTDNSFSILQEYNDPRIVLLRNKKNRGITPTLNRGLEVAKGDYIARMDADDISVPQRLKKQSEFLDTHPHIGLLGTNYLTINEAGNILFDSKPGYQTILAERDPITMRWKALWGSIVAHPTAMFRRSIVEKYDLRYDENIKYAQDRELWTQFLCHTEATYLPEPLLHYRKHSASISIAKFKIQSEYSYSTTRKVIHTLLQDNIDDRILRLLYQPKLISDFTLDELQLALLLMERIYISFIEQHNPPPSIRQLIRWKVLRRIHPINTLATKQHNLKSFRIRIHYYSNLLLYYSGKLGETWSKVSRQC